MTWLQRDWAAYLCYLHRIDFTDGTTKFFCKIFFVEQFDALRRNCGCEESYIASLASCCKWDSSGGKSGSVFLKTKGKRIGYGLFDRIV